MNTIDMVNRRKALDDIKPYTPGKPLWEVQEELGLKSVIASRLSLSTHQLMTVVLPRFLCTEITK
ncbi:hypothetical protein ACIQAA_19335 [Neobacillus sp. NPDC093182]|uniref:hypothetical protein n=1 Tax=Neobacillus sp. NPDC093182 TaxID=3364297 RepID=UPI003807B114